MKPWTVPVASKTQTLAEDFFAFRRWPHSRLPTLGTPTRGWYAADKGFEGREAGRRWLASGIPVNVVSAWLGHSQLQTTMV